MRAILDLRIRKITMKILHTTSLAIANTLTKKELSVDHIIPNISNKKLQGRITNALIQITKKI